MRDELEKLVAAGKITARHIDPLLALVQGGFCVHKGWGFGRVKTLDGILGRLIIDFQAKPAHSMDLVFAAEFLKAVTKDHVLALKATDMAGLRQKAALHHLDVVKLVLRSLGGRATVDQVQQILVPDVVSSDWKKWWETARAEMKRDGHFTIPTKKSEPILMQAVEVPLSERLTHDLRVAKGLKARLVAVAEVTRNISDLANGKELATAAITALNAEITSHVQTMPPLALEGIFARDDLRVAAGLEPELGEPTEKIIWERAHRLSSFFEEISSTRQRRALESFRNNVPEWGPQLVGILNSVSAKLCGETAKLLMLEGKTALLKDSLARVISQHGASSELLLWFGKERSDTFADILNPEVFRAMLTSMERDAFNERKNNRLHDFILADQELLPDLIGSADIEVIKDLTRTLQLSPAFDDMDRRSLLARIVKQYPVIQSMISGEQKKEDQTFLVSWEGLERRKDEYQDLVEKKVPANVKDIALARSYGDLRENHEYKAAKETQKVLNRRKHELESQLMRARGTDFSNVRTDIVSPGTIVKILDLDTKKAEIYTILGAWDGDPDKNILSYLTPLAQSFVSHPVGKEVEFLEGEAGSEGAKKRRLRIESIEPYKHS